MWSCLCPYHEDSTGSRGVIPVINLDTRWRWMVNFTPWPLYPHRKSLWYAMNRRLGGLQELVWTFWRRGKPVASAGNWNPDHQGYSLVTVLTTVCWLHSLAVAVVLLLMGSSIWNWISCVNMTSCNGSDRKFMVFKTECNFVRHSFTKSWAYIICYVCEHLWYRYKFCIHWHA